jgi:uncharacterized protein (TIGR03084 family)
VTDPHSFVDVLEAEQNELEDLLVTLADEDWRTPTPAEGWDVRDSVSHLADTEEIAHDTVTGGERNLGVEVERREAEGGVIQYGLSRGRVMQCGEVRRWWSEASRRNRAALRVADPESRVPWGLGMAWRSFVTARLMEHWAHGLDIRAAVGQPAPDTDRLEPIAWLCYSTLRYGFHVDGVEPPGGHTLRIELHGPAGETWVFGPKDASDSIVGPAGVWCRRAVQRISVAEAEPSLTVDGPLAELALHHARAFL